MSLEDEITAEAEREVEGMERREKGAVMEWISGLEHHTGGYAHKGIMDSIEQVQKLARRSRMEQERQRLYRHIISAVVESYNNSLEGQIRRGRE